MAKIFGVGWAKTGTTTFAECMRLLGYRHQTQWLDLAHDLPGRKLTRIMELARRFESFDDWPWLLLYKEFDAAFSGAKFVLTVRASDAWLQSYRSQLAREGEPNEERNKVRRILYGLPFPDVTDEQLVARYERHNAEVKAYFANRPDDLLIVDWTEGDGWAPLCAFLNQPVPKAAFPHMNKTPSARSLKTLARRGRQAMGLKRQRQSRWAPDR